MGGLLKFEMPFCAFGFCLLLALFEVDLSTNQDNEQARATPAYSSKNPHSKIRENRQAAGTRKHHAPQQATHRDNKGQGGTGIWPIEAAVKSLRARSQGPKRPRAVNLGAGLAIRAT